MSQCPINLFSRCPREPYGDDKNRPGVILLITLVILVILATLGYTLTARVASAPSDQYVIDYSQARTPRLR
jgi:hypothetical protein